MKYRKIKIQCFGSAHTIGLLDFAISFCAQAIK